MLKFRESKNKHEQEDSFSFLNNKNLNMDLDDYDQFSYENFILRKKNSKVSHNKNNISCDDEKEKF